MAETTDCPSPSWGDADKGWIARWWRTATLAQKGLSPLLSRYTTHLVVVLLVTVALSLTGMELPRSGDYLSIPTPAPHLGERDSEPATVRGGSRSGSTVNGPLLRAPVLRTTLVEPPTPVIVPTFQNGYLLADQRSALVEPPTPVIVPTAEDYLPVMSLFSPPTAPLLKANPEAKSEEATRREIITYTVRSGDTLSGIAAYFGLGANTLIWSNPSVEAVPDLLKLGQELIILPVDGACHTVVSGDTLESIAGYYKVTVEDIVNYEFDEIPGSGKLPVGLRLVIPGGKKPYIPRVVEHYTGPIPEDASRGTGFFDWPVSGRITCGFLCYPGHYAVDIGNVAGTPVYASDSGYVAKVGWSDIGYGKLILIDHGNGFQTLYAHLYTILVEEGTSVAKGTLVGKMGTTGNATGPHLHFEIREGGKQRNPIIYLPTN